LTTPVVQPAAAAVSGAGRPLLRTGRTLELRLRCAAGAACRGIVELTYTPRGGRTVVLGRFNVSIAAGGSRVAKAPLLRAGGALLRRTKRPVLRLAARSPLRLAKPFRARLSTK
jgi:hypothetical protein